MFKRKAKAKNDNRLTKFIDSIITIERKLEAARTELEDSKKHLEHEQSRLIDGEGVNVEDAITGVVRQQTNVDSLEGLLKQAMDRAVGLVAAGSVQHRQRLTEVEEELADARQAIDARKIKTIAGFAKKHGLRVSWPEKDNRGVMYLPAMTIEGDQLRSIADAVVTSVNVDEDASKLEELVAEKQRLTVIIGSTPDLALASLLSERRRQ